MVNHEYDPSWRILNNNHVFNCTKTSLSAMDLQEVVRRGVEGFNPLIFPEDGNRCGCTAMVNLDTITIQIPPEGHNRFKMPAAHFNRGMPSPPLSGLDRPASEEDVERQVQERVDRLTATVRYTRAPFLYVVLVLDPNNYPSCGRSSVKQLLQQIIANYNDDSAVI